LGKALEIDKLIDSKKNVYEMTCVAIKEAAILSEDRESVEDIESRQEKIVSAALNKVLDNEVEYTVPSEQ